MLNPQHLTALQAFTAYFFISIFYNIIISILFLQRYDFHKTLVEGRAIARLAIPTPKEARM
jgi:hypothetical protein